VDGVLGVCHTSKGSRVCSGGVVTGLTETEVEMLSSSQ
jgi:hypothetical protein